MRKDKEGVQGEEREGGGAGRRSWEEECREGKLFRRYCMRGKRDGRESKVQCFTHRGERWDWRPVVENRWI